MNPAFATMGAGAPMPVQDDDRERTKGADELDPYVKCSLIPFDMAAQTEDAVDAGHDPDWTGVDAKGKSIHKNRLEFVVTPKAAKKANPRVEPRLRLEAWDEDVGVDDFLGQAVVPLFALVDAAAYATKMAAVEAEIKEAKVKQFMSEAEAQKKELLESKAGKQMTAGTIAPHPPTGASPRKKKPKVRRMSTSLFEGQRTAVGPPPSPLPSASPLNEAKEEEEEEDEFDAFAAEEVHDAEEVLDLERAERFIGGEKKRMPPPPGSSRSSAEAPEALRPAPPLDGEPARRAAGTIGGDRRGGLLPQPLPLWSQTSSAATSNAEDVKVDPSLNNHRLSNGTVKRLELTDRKGDRHVGWIEVMVTWTPDEAAIESIDPESRGSAKGRRGGSPRASGTKGIVGRPMVGTLVVEVLRGEGLNLCEDNEHTSAAADPVLFTGALVTLVMYLLLGGVFYVLNEEHCEDPVMPGLPVAAATAAGVDADGDGLITVDELTEWGRPNAPPPVCSSWTIVDAGYFTVLTFTTIGYGDFGPSNATSKLFTAVFALLGVTLIGAACGIVVGYFMEVLDMQLQKAAEAAKELGHDDEDEEEDEQVKGNKVVPILSAAEKQDLISKQKMAAKRRSIYTNVGHLLVTFGTGMLLFHVYGNGDDTSFIDLFYAAVITSCSVGYGDYSFDSQTGRGLCTFYAIGAVPMVAKFVGSVSSYVRSVDD